MRFRKVLWQTLWRYRIIAATPEWLLKTQFFWNNVNFSSEKNSWPTFSGNVEHDKCQGQIYKDPEGLLTVFLRKDFLGPQRSLETNVPKEGYLPVTKDFGPFFLVLSIVTNLTEQFISVQKVSGFFCKDTRSKRIIRKRLFFKWEKNWSILSRKTEHGRNKATLGCTRCSANPCAG